MKVRRLAENVQQKAIEELNEDPKRIEEDLQYIREWLKKQPHLKIRDEDQWLLTFLRGCKFSLERTKEKLDMFYTMRTIIPEFFSHRNPMDPVIQEILALGVCLPLSKPDSPGAERVLLIRNGIYDAKKYEISDVFKTNMMIMDILINEDDNFVICGEHILQDMTSMSMGHIAGTSPSLSKKAMTCWQQSYPARPKGVHFMNIPSFFEVVFNLFKPFLTEKMTKRMNIYTKDDKDNVYKVIPKSIMPKEYGGDGQTIAELTEFWKKKVESYKDWFAEDAKYKSDESKRPGKPKTSTDVFGIEGSFRKLNVD